MPKTQSARIPRNQHKLPETIVVKDLSELCQDVLQTFGVEAPALLNKYACTVEDAFIETQRRLQDTKIELDLMTEAHDELKKKVAELEKKLLSESVAQ